MLPFRGLLIQQARNARQLLTFQELQRGAAAGGDVRDLVGEAELFDRSGRVAAADDRDRAGLRQRRRDGFRAGGKGREPIGPFQTTVPAPLTASVNSWMVSGPMSRPIQSAGMALVGTTLRAQSAANWSPAMVSTGSSSFTPRSFAFWIISSA